MVRPLIILALWTPFILAGCSSLPQTGCRKRENLDPEIERVIDDFRASVPETMRKGKIPGTAIALIDNEGILWTEGFGTTDRTRRIPVTPDTPFLICSMSKTFTATAVMLAVWEGLLDLDEPITTYLPDFKVYSRYEEHPEQKITLRRLLSHTSGLPHEAVGSNMLEPTGSFEDRVRSLYGTWLKCPVGQAFSYSGAGTDLAAYVLQVVSGIEFEQYMEKRIFGPLGMPNSTVDMNEIRSNSNRAIGHTTGIAKYPSTHSLLGAGGVFTSAADLARFIRMHINKGTFEGNRLLDESLIDIMLTPLAIVDKPEDECYYGLGVMMGGLPGGEDVVFQHAGGGGGYCSLMYWYPEYAIGGLVLTNRVPHSVLGDLLIGRRLIKASIVEKRFPAPALEFAKCVPSWDKWPDHAPSPYKPEWKKYCGKYDLRLSGYKLEWWASIALALGLDKYTPRIKVYKKDGYLYVTESRLMGNFFHDWQGARRLQEARRGLFFTSSGSALDFRGEIPTWRNYRLKKR